MRLSEEEFATLQQRMGIKQPEKPKKPTKYRNVKTNGNASKHENDIKVQLEYMALAGEIISFIEQVPFQVADKVKYLADFVVLYPDEHYEVWDAKGAKTSEYIIKKKLMKSKFGIEIKEC